jgi:hypothetical protein
MASSGSSVNVTPPIWHKCLFYEDVLGLPGAAPALRLRRTALGGARAAVHLVEMPRAPAGCDA